jgi:hypothetical protein
MYEQINKELEVLQQGIYRRQKIDSMLKSLWEQMNMQEKKQTQLEQELEKENLDVEKLSKMGLASMFHTILGSREKQLEKERQEALSAQLKYDDIKRQITDTKQQLSLLQKEEAGLRDCQRKYDELFMKKYEMLKQNDAGNTKKIVELENKISLFKANQREISEAISAGNSVMHSLDRTSESLDSAEGWGMWDLWGGGGLITDMVKHGHIDDARSSASEVQMLLNRFRTELADVKVSSQITIDIDGFVKFADFFFDGLIADWVVQSRISESQESVGNVKEEVSSVLRKLSQMQGDNNKEIQVLENQLSRIITNA